MKPPASSEIAPHAPYEPDEATRKAAQVQAMFSAIARRYDLLNRLLSAGLDGRWRAQATRAAFRGHRRGAALRVLDVATGTADLAISLKRARPDAEVVGVDFAEPMLAIGRRKAAKRGLDVRLEQGDGLHLSFEDAQFDIVTIAYGLRNFADIDRGLREFFRVLKPGGRLVVLEFPPPPTGLFGRLFRTYFLQVLPRLGGLVSGRGGAYRYLPESVLRFPTPKALAVRVAAAGFVGVRFRLQTLGVSALHTALKPALKPPLSALHVTPTPLSTAVEEHP